MLCEHNPDVVLCFDFPADRGMLCEHDPNVVYCFKDSHLARDSRRYRIRRVTLRLPAAANRRPFENFNIPRRIGSISLQYFAAKNLLTHVGFSLDQLKILAQNFLWEGEYRPRSYFCPKPWYAHTFAFYEHDARRGLNRDQPFDPSNTVRRPPSNGCPYALVENQQRPHRLTALEFDKLVRLLRSFSSSDLEELLMSHIVGETRMTNTYYLDEWNLATDELLGGLDDYFKRAEAFTTVPGEKGVFRAQKGGELLFTRRRKIYEICTAWKRQCTERRDHQK